MTARAAITGVNGFVGSHLAEALLAAGREVVGVCRSRSRLDNLQGIELELRRAHTLDREALVEAFRGCDLIYHVAGLTKTWRSEELWRINAEGSACVARAAVDAGVRRLLLVSSAAAVGPAPLSDPATEDRHPAPVSQYGRSKRGGEVEAWKLAAEIELAILRPPMVYGPRDSDMLENMRVAKRGLVMKPGLGPDPAFSIIHVQDLVVALQAAASAEERVDPAEDPERPSGQGIFHVHDGEPVPWTEIGKMQARLLGRRPRILPVPFWIQGGLAHGSQWLGVLRGRAPIFNPDKVREARQVGWVLGCERSHRTLGFEPRVGLERGTEMTIAWYRERGLI